jgi:Rrf2 family protein
VLSQKTRYALKALLELAALPAGVRLSSGAISFRRTIPGKFLEAILVELQRDGLVRGKRGRSGGYQLAQSARAISFGGVVRLMEGPLALLPCVSKTQHRRCADCGGYRACALRKVFRTVRDSTASILDEWTLADACGGGSPGKTHLATPGRKAGGRSVKQPSRTKRAVPPSIGVKSSLPHNQRDSLRRRMA